MKLIAFLVLFTTPLMLSAQNESVLEIIEFIICKDVLDREPFEPVQSFNVNDERAWSFARIKNDGEMKRIDFVWNYEGVEYFRLTNRVGTSPGWRTYSSVSLQPGSWSVEIRDENNTMLREIRFHVSE